MFRAERLMVLIPLTVFLKSFCSNRLFHKSVNLSFTITYIKTELTDSCGNGLLQNDLRNILCQIREVGRDGGHAGASDGRV